MAIAYVLFFIAGIGFGYAAAGLGKLLPMLFPLALAIGPVVGQGLDGTILARLVLALIVTGIGIAAGAALDHRARRAATSAGS